MNRTVLVVAFDFPPAASSSGLQRALKTVRYLRGHGWNPVVLTATPNAYPVTNPSQLDEIPDDVPVERAFALDARRTFSIRGRYPGFLAWPDPWACWYLFASRAGKKLIRAHRPAAIWSTFPINTVNLIALKLAKWAQLPWIADLRDPISLEGYPPDASRFRIVRAIEKRLAENASRVVFTADYTRRMYIDRYPSLEPRAVVIPNGYDETNFPVIRPAGRTADAPPVFLHSGSLQPKGRNPAAFFEAIRMLKSAGRITPSSFRIMFRACGYEDQYKAIAEDLGITEYVGFGSRIPYEEAITEMVRADALLVFQGPAYNHAVPAKLYEYFFTGKPVLGILDKSGEAQSVLEGAGIGHSANIDSAEDIAESLVALANDLGEDSSFIADPSAVAGFSRRNQVGRLALLLDEVVNDAARTETAGTRADRKREPS